jgi:acetylornithine deacetylase/succinyl-diaminopimelate desuccinylase-like protein
MGPSHPPPDRKGGTAVSTRHDRLALLDRYVRLATVSRRVTPAMVAAVRALWQEVGLALAPLLPADGAGTPCLYGDIPGPPGAPTLLVYGHYDVQPPGDAAQWVWEGVPCHPFTPAYFHEGQPVDPATLPAEALDGVVMVARGGADNKGQHLAALLGVLDAARAGTLQWHVKVLLDGEEEHGSPHLRAVAERYRDRLAADLVVGSDGPKQQNRPTLVLGVRGLLIVDIVAENGAPASLHSGNYGNILPNPVLPLARLIAEVEGRVRAYAERHDAFRRQAEQTFAELATEATWRPFLWPTVNVNHLMSEGASPELTRTIIPRSVHARLDVRLTPDTPPAAVRALVEAAATSASRGGEPGISFTVRTGDDLPASFTPPEHPACDWLLGLLAEAGGPPVVVPLLGGTLPGYVFTEVLRLPTFWLPAANSDNRQHDINEHYVLAHFFQQMDLYRRIASSRPAPVRPAG